MQQTDNIARNPEVDLTNCDREPIHRLGLIQSFGFVIAIAESGSVVGASENAGRLFGEAVLGKHYSEVLPEGLRMLVEDRLRSERVNEQVERFFSILFSSEYPSLDVSLHRMGEHWILEFEPSLSEPSVEPVYLVKRMVSSVKAGSPDLGRFCQTAVRHLKRLTGFDRVMVYRFGDDGSGEVIAEACEEHLEKFLGLHYPAADIPAQARRLYTINHLRFIVDIDDVPCTMQTLNGDASSIDLTRTNLRSVSKIHVEYLRNMGVRASMSVSILRDGELWGLFALHHYSPRLLSVQRRVASELFGEFFSALLADLEHRDDFKLFEFADSLTTAPGSEEEPLNVKLESLARNLASFVECDGLFISWRGASYAFSDTPGSESIARILEAGLQQANSAFLETEELSTARAWLADEASCFAGILGSGFSGDSSLKIILFRKEILSTVKWGGAPEKEYDVGPNGPRLSPRKSFEEWTELVYGKCKPWSSRDRRSLSILRALAIEHLTSR